MLAAVLVTTGRYIEAEALYQDLLRRAEHFGGTDHPLVAHYSLGLATTLYAAGRSTEADTVCQDALRSYARAAGRNSHNFVAFLSYVGVALCEVKRFAEAERYSREAIEIAREIGEGPHSMSLVLSRLARILLEAGHSEEALKQATDALAKTEEAYGRQSPSAQIDAKTCVAALSALGRAEEANEFRTRYKL
jgi:tetratricopeptide (TPR) repeat protein